MASHIAIVLPGAGYGPLGPAVRFPALAIAQFVADVHELIHGPRPEPDDWATFYDQVVDQIDRIVADADIERLTFIAKSLGTRVLATIAPPNRCQNDGKHFRDLADATVRRRCRARWRLFDRVVIATDRSTADPYHDPPGFIAVADRLAATTCLIEGADHSLEIPGDVLSSVEIMRTVTSEVLDFGETP